VGAVRAGALALLAGSAALGACSNGDDGGPRAIVEERVTSAPARPARFGASPEERFGFGPIPSAGPSAAQPVERPLDPSTLPFGWDVPPGWASRAPTSVRLVNLVVEEDPRAECYVTLLPGDGGGLTENVNRWRAQMGLAPIDAEAVRALPRIAMFGTGATLVDLAGPFQGMSGPRIEDARMLGAILTQPEFTLYVKMTGPAALVERERDRLVQVGLGREGLHAEAIGDLHARHGLGRGEALARRRRAAWPLGVHAEVVEVEVAPVPGRVVDEPHEDLLAHVRREVGVGDDHRLVVAPRRRERDRAGVAAHDLDPRRAIAAAAHQEAGEPSGQGAR
jgi:hypothetical protein